MVPVDLFDEVQRLLREFRWKVRFENAIISLVLAAIVALPILEAVLRKTLHIGISNSRLKSFST